MTLINLVAGIFLIYWLGWQGILFVLTVAGLLVLLSGGKLLEKPGLGRVSEPPQLPPNEVERQIRTAHAAIETHAIALSDKRNQLLVADSYGFKDPAAWEKEKGRFIKGVIRNEVGPRCAITEASLAAYIDRKIDEFRRSYPQLANRTPELANVTPLQYENECTRILREAGWTAYTTKASGDQGGDIVAEIHGIKVVLQCKKYASPVGNKAVQEVFAARRFYNADYAVVVTNSDFTKAAHILAQRTGVILLHHNDLPSLESKLM